MTLPQAEQLFAYWRGHPPVHELVAAYLRYKPRSTSGPMPATKISPSIGDIPPFAPPPAKVANDLGALAALAKTTGGDISLGDMVARLG